MSVDDKMLSTYYKNVMRTTIAIDEYLMDELMRAEKGVSRSEAVRRAVEAHVYQKRVDQFIEFARTRPVDKDWREMERIEMKDAERMHQQWDKAGRGRKR